jgi:hypothetical protein
MKGIVLSRRLRQAGFDWIAGSMKTVLAGTVSTYSPSPIVGVVNLQLLLATSGLE